MLFGLSCLIFLNLLNFDKRRLRLFWKFFFSIIFFLSECYWLYIRCMNCFFNISIKFLLFCVFCIRFFCVFRSF